MVMKIKGYKGDFWIGLNEAATGHLKSGSWDLRRRLHEKWYGVQLHGRWIEGSHQGAWM
jgi:hypothetical protein